jgi:DNA primase
MSRIKDASVDEVKAAADMVSVVSARSPLRKAGARYVGRCPFHEERTPSFSVNAVDKLYYCFGCGAKGDLITFVRETEQLDFAGAIEWLADRFNVQIEYEETSPEQDARRRRRERLLEVLEAAASFYERYLWDSQAGSLARDYLAGRGLGEEVCRQYRLGLAPGGSTLTRKALERGFTRDELLAAGLGNRRGNDYFFGRLLFPLADARGRVLGFQARKLREDDPLKAKYVNSPEGELFRKGDLLYGLDRARAAIAKQERAVVVEGNTDVLALSQAGIEPVVASMGTALTERQLKELSRLTNRVWLCFDGDAAGETATLRGMELAAAQGLDVRVVALPAGFDPADLAEGFDTRLGRAETYLGYRVRLEIERAADRQEGFIRVREVLARFEESPERQDAIRYAADKLDLPKETQQGLAPSKSASSTGRVSARLLDAGERLEQSALAGVAAHRSLIPVLAELGPEHFDREELRRLREQLLSGAEPEGDLVGLLAELDARATSEGIDERTAEQFDALWRRADLRCVERAALPSGGTNAGSASPKSPAPRIAHFAHGRAMSAVAASHGKTMVAWTPIGLAHQGSGGGVPAPVCSGCCAMTSPFLGSSRRTFRVRNTTPINQHSAAKPTVASRSRGTAGWTQRISRAGRAAPRRRRRR